MIFNSRNMKFYILFITGCIVFANAQDDSNSTSTNTTIAESATQINTTTTESPTTIITTTTEAPSPPNVDNPKTYQWTVNSTDNVCLVLKAGIQFEFTYNQSNKEVKTKMNIEKNQTNVSDKSSCENDTNILILEFGNNTFTMEFLNENGKVYLAKAALQYFIDNTTFPGATNLYEIVNATDNTTEFKTSLGKSYLCKAGTDFKLAANLTVHMENVQVQAFRHENNTDFSEAEECGGDNKINDIVPIAVGCALALLVIIVLIAYLVGRRRSRQQGYQSV